MQRVALMELRTAVRCVLGFASFFRVREILNIKLSHISISQIFSYIYILVPSSKADKRRQGNTVIISADGT